MTQGLEKEHFQFYLLLAFQSLAFMSTYLLEFYCYSTAVPQVFDSYFRVLARHGNMFHFDIVYMCAHT